MTTRCGERQGLVVTTGRYISSHRLHHLGGGCEMPSASLIALAIVSVAVVPG